MNSELSTLDLNFCWQMDYFSSVMGMWQKTEIRRIYETCERVNCRDTKKIKIVGIVPWEPTWTRWA